ncbi:MAG: GPW/gp25 family protein [Candidatus Sulfotelmatobacter sp.]|jgi:phage baseplate assembly protein W
MLADFLGKGWNFPVQHGGGHAIAISPGEESIQQSIWIILATAPGERVMRPDFGCGLHHLVFAVNEAETLGEVKKQVRDALVKWEPRIDVLDVDTEVRGRGEVLLINVHYRVRTTNNFFNLVYPFYLGVGS